jgi:hypothetical protein
VDGTSGRADPSCHPIRGQPAAKTTASAEPAAAAANGKDAASSAAAPVPQALDVGRDVGVATYDDRSIDVAMHHGALRRICCANVGCSTAMVEPAGSARATMSVASVEE